MQNTKKKDKLEPSNVLENSKYLLDFWPKLDKSSIAFAASRIPVLIIMPVLTAFIPALMIQAITENWMLERLILIVVLLAGLVAMLNWLEPFLGEKIKVAGIALRMHLSIEAFQKALYMDYSKLESSKTRKEWEGVREFAFRGSGADSAYMLFTSMAANIFGIFSYIAILRLLDWRLIMIIFTTCIGEYLLKVLLRRTEWETKLKRWDVNSRFQYLYRVAIDPVAAKDISVFGARDWLLYQMAKTLVAFRKGEQKAARRFFVAGVGVSLVNAVRDLAAYAFLVQAVLNEHLTVANFIFYFGIVTGFSAWIMGLAGQYDELKRLCRACQRFRTFLDEPSQEDGALPIPKRWDTLELRNVSYTYESAVEPVLSNISLTVKHGERISLVGANGAGKTTLIKIIAGFYKPTQGEILLNGKPLWDYQREGRFSKMAALFQDFNFFPLSIAENITIEASEEQDHTHLKKVMRQAGIWDAVNELKDGVKSMLVKEVHDDAVAFSGGQTQRLLLARALYKKDAQLLILDEPTAALDPIAENKLYVSYAELMKGMISFFVSHRLSSTRFCERILYMSEGQIIEEGTHDQLMKQRGDYWRTYEIQSHYYKEKRGKDV